MNLSPRWIGLLNHAGWEAVYWSTVGSTTAADSEIMAFAAENDYVVLTHQEPKMNRRFAELSRPILYLTMRRITP